jgi:NADPH-dependent glutamate synthase beta subunit-like oxidoreductase
MHTLRMYTYTVPICKQASEVFCNTLLCFCLQDPREYLIQTKRFIGNAEGNVTGVETIRIDWQKNDKGAVSIYMHTCTHNHAVHAHIQSCSHVASSKGHT